MATGLKERVLEQIDSIQDPCSLAQAIPVGLSEMGLVTDLRISEPDAEGRSDVELTLRVTAPGCLYMPFMDSSIKAALGELEEVGEITTEWDPEADWSPSEIAEPARKRIAASRAERLSLLRERQAARAAERVAS